MKKKRKEKIEKNACWFAPDVNPNLVTFASICAMVAAAIFVFRGEFLYAGFLVLLSGFLDLMDGAIAKKYRRTSAFGSFFDKVADRINDAVIIGAVILAGLVNTGLGLLVLALILLSSYLSAVIDSIWTKKQKGEELSLRWIRLLVIVGGLFAKQIELMMFVLLVIGLYSFFDRFVFAARHFNRKK